MTKLSLMYLLFMICSTTIINGQNSDQQLFEFNLSQDYNLRVKYAGKIWNFTVTPDANITSDTNSIIVSGKIEFFLESDQLVIPPEDRGFNLRLPGNLSGDSFDKFASNGWIGVLNSLEGAGYVIVLEGFGSEVPVITTSETHNSFIINHSGKIRMIFFDDGGYVKLAEVFRHWLKDRGYYRHIYDKPYAQELAGAAFIRPVQHGAISQEVWKKIVKVFPKAVLTWRTNGTNTGAAAYQLDRFSKEVQQKIDESGEYFFVPWGGIKVPVAPASSRRGSSGLEQYSFSTIPDEMYNKWRFLNEEGQVSASNLCPLGFPDRMTNWIDRIQQHPYCYRLDGVNIDTYIYYFSPSTFERCCNPSHPAGFIEWVDGLAGANKIAFDKGLFVIHEGLAFFADQYALAAYGGTTSSIGTYSGWQLKESGKSVEPADVAKTISNHVPVSQLIYHDQLIMMLHNTAEALNVRFANDYQYNTIRRIKHTFNALYGLAPSVNMGGAKADSLILEDLKWMQQEIPEALEIYKQLYGKKLINHQFLSQDRLVQKTTFEDGTSVIANFDNSIRSVKDITVKPYSYIILKEKK